VEVLTKIAKDSSLRYAIQLITTSGVLAQREKSAEVKIPHIRKAYSLFLDETRSTKYLEEYQNEFMFNEAVGMEEDPNAAEIGSGDTTQESVDLTGEEEEAEVMEVA